MSRLSYYQRYIPEEIALFILLKGDGQFLMHLLLVVPPSDDGSLLSFEVILDPHAGAQQDSFSFLEDFDVVDAFFFKFIGEDEQKTMSHELILAGCVVCDSVHLDCGLEALEWQISLRIHRIFSLKVYKIIRFKRGLSNPL